MCAAELRSSSRIFGDERPVRHRVPRRGRERPGASNQTPAFPSTGSPGTGTLRTRWGPRFPTESVDVGSERCPTTPARAAVRPGPVCPRLPISGHRAARPSGHREPSFQAPAPWAPAPFLRNRPTYAPRPSVPHRVPPVRGRHLPYGAPLGTAGGHSGAPANVPALRGSVRAARTAAPDPHRRRHRRGPRPAWRRRTKRVALGVALAVIVLVAGGVALRYNNCPNERPRARPPQAGAPTASIRPWRRPGAVQHSFHYVSRLERCQWFARFHPDHDRRRRVPTAGRQDITIGRKPEIHRARRGSARPAI